MSSRSERYLAKAEKCQQISDAADTSGTKRLFGVLASQWRQLAEEAEETDQIGSTALSVKIRYAHTLRQIDEAEGAIREFGAVLNGEPLLTPKEYRQLADPPQAGPVSLRPRPDGDADYRRRKRRDCLI